MRPAPEGVSKHRQDLAEADRKAKEERKAIGAAVEAENKRARDLLRGAKFGRMHREWAATAFEQMWSQIASYGRQADLNGEERKNLKAALVFISAFEKSIAKQMKKNQQAGVNMEMAGALELFEKMLGKAKALSMMREVAIDGVWQDALKEADSGTKAVLLY